MPRYRNSSPYTSSISFGPGGLSTAMKALIGANVVVCVLAALVAWASPAAVSASVAAAPSSGHPPLVLPLLLVSGITSFTYEVVWTRLLGHILGGSTYAFATMLATFLAGIALGAAAAARLATTPERAARGFALAQVLLGVLRKQAAHAARAHVVGQSRAR